METCLTVLVTIELHVGGINGCLSATRFSIRWPLFLVKMSHIPHPLFNSPWFGLRSLTPPQKVSNSSGTFEKLLHPSTHTQWNVSQASQKDIKEIEIQAYMVLLAHFQFFFSFLFGYSMCISWFLKEKVEVKTGVFGR